MSRHDATCKHAELRRVSTKAAMAKSHPGCQVVPQMPACSNLDHVLAHCKADASAACHEPFDFDPLFQSVLAGAADWDLMKLVAVLHFLPCHMAFGLRGRQDMLCIFAGLLQTPMPLLYAPTQLTRALCCNIASRQAQCGTSTASARYTSH